MPIDLPHWLVKLETEFKQRGYSLYLVGGAVRDRLLNRPVAEWDLTTNARPDEIESILRAIRAQDIGLIGKRFGTITGRFQGEVIEITTFRGEVYREDSRHPVTQWGDKLEDDLARRDFTINAIAAELTGQRLIDPFDGQNDLTDQLIRAVGNPHHRFDEDPLRMIRAIRFAVQLGFTIEAATAQAIYDCRDRLAILSAERINQEMNKILLSDQPSRGIELLVQSGLINYILPELLAAIDLDFDPKEHKDIYQHILTVLDQTPKQLELRWCALLHDIAKPLTREKIGNEYHFLGHENVGAKMARQILRRLKYSNEFIDKLVQLVRQHQRIPGYDGSWSDGGVRRFARDAGDLLDDLFVFAEADVTGKNEQKKQRFATYRRELRERIDQLQAEAEIAKIKSPLDGSELMAIFHRPAGPWIKPIKDHLLGLVLDGQLKEEDKATAETIARQLIKDQRL